MSDILSEKQLERAQAKFAENLYALREQRGWTAEELAVKIGTSKSYIYQVEGGTFFPRMARLLMLKKAFKLKTLEPLLRGL